MSDYWISDAEGRVLGPVGLTVLGDLLGAGRITGVTKVSRDGTTWSPLEQHPELLRLTQAASAPDRSEREKADAQKLRTQLEGLRTRPAHEIFKVDKDAPLETFREAFFKLSKKFHPEVVPKDAHPDLKDACAMAFRFFGALMQRVESGLARPMAPPEPPPAKVAPPAPVPTPPPAPAYNPEDFVGLKSLGPGLAQARIRVTRENAGMFSDHPMMNLARGSFFLTDERVLPLGTTVALTFNFEDPEHTIIARGKVVWEDAGKGGKRHGFGISLQELTADDREFLQAFVRSMQAAKKVAPAPALARAR